MGGSEFLASLKVNLEGALPPWVKFDYLVAFSFFLLALVSLWVRPLFKKLLLKFFLRDKRLTKTEKILVSLSSWISYFFFLLFLNFALLQFPLGNFLKVLDTLFFILYTIIITFVVMRLVEITLEKLSQGVKKKVSPEEAPLVDTYYSMISKIANIFVVFVALIAVLDRLGFNVASLITSLGVGSLAVGLAAKDTIKNFISGILLVTDRQFRIGDRVYIKDIGVEGYVYDIGLRTTRILTVSGNNLITVPNSKLTEGVIENSLYPDPKVKDSVEVGVAYGTDVNKVKELLLKAVSGIPGVLSNPSPSVYFTQFGESSLIFKLIYYVKEKDLAFKVKSLLNERIKELFEREGIEIPFPQRDVWFRNPLTLRGHSGKAFQRKDEEL